MNLELKDSLQKKLDEEQKDFLKKKSAEKFKILYERTEELEALIDNLESNECCCDHDDDLEKIKNEQLNILERLNYLEDSVEELEDRLDKLELKINGGSNPSGNI